MKKVKVINDFYFFHMNLIIKMEQSKQISGRDERKTSHDAFREGRGFSAMRYISPKLRSFMHLEELDSGEMVSMAFATKFLALYITLGGLHDPNDKRYINFNGALIDLFNDGLRNFNINPSRVTWIELQKLLSRHYVSGLLSPEAVSLQPPGAIGRPGNLKTLGATFTFMREQLKQSRNHPDMIKTLKISWLCLGLPGWTEEKIVINDVKIVRMKVYGGDDDPDCCICMDGKKNTVFLPCRHMCCCTSCSSELQKANQVCPICRQNIVNTQEFNPEKHDNND